MTIAINGGENSAGLREVAGKKLLRSFYVVGVHELKNVMTDELLRRVAEDASDRRASVIANSIGSYESVSVPTVFDDGTEAVQRLVLRLLALKLPNLLRSSEQLNEDLDFGAEDFRYQRLDEIVHSAEGVRLGRG